MMVLTTLIRAIVLAALTAGGAVLLSAPGHARGHVECHNSAVEQADTAIAAASTAAGDAAGGEAGGIGSRQWDDTYNAVYTKCMGNRASQPSFNVGIPVIGGTCVQRPESQHQRCEARYRSYDRCSGTFQPFNGPRRLCQ